MLIKQTYLTLKFTISDFHSFKSNQHKHKGISHFQDYLPKKQNPRKEKEKAILQTEIWGKKVKTS